MKKSKLSLCLASSIVAALSLVACNSVSSNDEAVVTITDYNGNEVDILTNAIYDEYKKDTDGVSKFYNAILEALIRYEYADTNSGVRTRSGWTKSIKSTTEIKNEAESNVENDKSTAKNNAKTNDTSYEKEWDAILESHGCEDEDDLLEYYIYQAEKQDITEVFLLQHKDTTLLNEWIGVDKDGKDVGGSAKAVFPYHIRHVLASISGGEGDYVTGTISSSEAKKLGQIMKDFLNSGYNFGRTAMEESGDTGSAEKSGDVGLMTTTTSFVNEFKLGIYAYDALYNQDNASKAGANTIKKGLGIDNSFTFDLSKSTKNIGIQDAWTSASGLNGGDIQTVPFGLFYLLNDLAETELDDNGKQVNGGDEHYFPRNVLYNHYLNFHNPFVITYEDVSTTNGLPTDYVPGTYPNVDTARFVDANIKGVTKKVLADENGNVIIGCRSSHGIHFMIMEKSIYEYDNYDVSDPNKPTLAEYYTSLTPSDPNYPKVADGEHKGENKASYVTSLPVIDEGKSDYNTRASEIKTAVQSFDSTYDYRLYEYLLNDLEKDTIKINVDGLKESIDKYISRTRDSNNDNAYKTLNETWRTYTQSIAHQYELRYDWNIPDSQYKADASFRNISPRCAVGFASKTKGETPVDPLNPTDEWQKGGFCYHEN